ncbi:MAG: type II toxin-antitoxin system Phd/YefM family antitoxin [Chloroflexota bacterium]
MPAMQVNIHEAKTHLSRLVERVAAGEEVVIARSGKPIAKLVPYAEELQPRVPGSMAGKIWIADDFDASLPPEILAGFYGEDFDEEAWKQADPTRREHTERGRHTGGPAA